jgi:hypothetical protein
MVLVAILAIALLVGSYFFFSSLNLAAVRVDRDRATNDVLARAKEALIAYAAADQNRPGELPCPDVNDDGKLVIGEDLVGSACASLTGRLPWITLGLPDLRDDAGERLWYSLSNDFHANGTVALNSDTAYRSLPTPNLSLTLTGTTPATNLVAIVFSPGTVLTRTDGIAQARGCTVGVDCDAARKCTTAPASNTPKCNPANFLDIANGEDNADANRIFTSAPRSESFNDRLMPVFSDDIMWLVERRAARELAQRLREHYDAWQGSAVVAGTDKGFYPYAVPFGDPATAAVGTNGTTSGMLPLANTPLTWSNASLECTGNGTATLDCNGLVVCILGICALTFSGQIDNVATRFVDPPIAANVNVILGVALGGAATWTMNKAARRLEFSYGGFLLAGNVHVQVSAPATSSWVNTSWLTANNWHQNAYYALSSGYAIDHFGPKSCGPPPGEACVTISNTAAPTDNKEAAIVMTGRALGSAGQATRPLVPPAPVLAQFLEGVNLGGGIVFQSNAKTATFNDYPVAVRP